MVLGGETRHSPARVSGHHDRGTCENSLVVRRPMLESQIVDLVTREMLSPTARVRFVRSFNDALKRTIRPEPEDPSRLRAAEAEVQNLVAGHCGWRGRNPRACHAPPASQSAGCSSPGAAPPEARHGAVPTGTTEHH